MKKNLYNITGYPTPDYTTESLCRSFNIPNSTLALGAFMGALWPLANPEAWQQYGDMTPEESAAMIQDILWSVMLAEDVCRIAETPYWDTAANVDDTLPAGSETWYGQIVALATLRTDPELTFLDNLGIWLVAGFIAYAGLPGAAIAFVPVARRFVLYFKSSPTGAIVNILADFLHIADIDTYAVEDKIMTVLVTMPDDATTLYVEQAAESNPLAGDNPQIQVVRSELTEANFAPPNYRYNSDCDCVQYSPDGGITWNDAPQSDPRHASPFRLPIRGGDDKNCNAAANMVAWLKAVIDACIHICEVGGIVVALVNKILDFAEVIFAEEGGILLTLIQAIAGTIFDVGFTALTAAFTSGQYEKMLCIFYCNIDGDGQASPTQFAEIQTEITEQLNTVAATVTNLFLSLQGEVGLSNAGAQGTATADCSDCGCGWCYTFDFTLSDGGWSADSRGSGAIYDGAAGWGSQYADRITGTYIHLLLSSSAVVTHVQMTFNVIEPTTNYVLFGRLDGDGGFTDVHSASGGGVVNWSGEATVNELGLQVGNCTDCDSEEGASHITKATFRGTGTNPFGDNNC